LRLYITGRGERSERALSNLRRLCEQNLAAGTYEIEVVDLMKHPELAKADQILAIPTLVRKLPEPMKRVIGDLSNADRALLSLDFPKTDSSAR
jgi:circadian clock protein KaiB